MRLVQYYLVRLRVCRLSAIGISVGPFDCEKDRKLSRKLIALIRFRYLCVRDEASIDKRSLLTVNYQLQKGIGIQCQFYIMIMAGLCAFAVIECSD